MSNEKPKPRKYDLAERTSVFGESIVEFGQSVQQTAVTYSLIRQVVRSGTSVGANYCEADDALTRKDFKYRIGICKKESRETKYWLRMMAKAIPDRAEEIRPLWKEADELHRIFITIARNTKDV